MNLVCSLGGPLGETKTQNWAKLSTMHSVLRQVMESWGIRLIAVLGLPFVLWGCNSHTFEAPKPDPSAENEQVRELNPIRNVDLLFVVDNSGSMGEEQMNLARNFPAFMGELKQIEGIDLHVGVVSSDLGGGLSTFRKETCPLTDGDRGIFCNVRGKDCRTCGLSAGNFLTYKNGGAAVNFTGSIEDAFSCMAKVGTAGCSFEHSLESMRRALHAPENKGFIRDGAYLAVVIITDEDDCSAAPTSNIFATDNPMEDASFRCARTGHICNGKAVTGTEAISAPLGACAPADNGGLIPIKDLVKDLVAIKKDPRFIIMSGIFGWPLPGTEGAARYSVTRAAGNQGGRLTLQPICTSNNGSATPALRVHSFVNSFAQTSFFSICQDNFSDAMKRIGEKIRIAIGPPCVDAPLADSNLQNKTFDIECSVVDRMPTAMGYNDTPLPECKVGRKPCWAAVPDKMCTASGYRIDVQRVTPPPPGLLQQIRCRTCAKPGC